MPVKYLLKAIKLMPNDPIVNDHFGDILWMLNKKLQARYKQKMEWSKKLQKSLKLNNTTEIKRLVNV